MQSKYRRSVSLNSNRRCCGESHPAAKLTDHEVHLILELWSDGLPAAVIARKFEISRQHVYRIARGINRSHIVVCVR